jgi:hypothetical protein
MANITDIDNYTVNDILSIFNIVDPTVFNVTDVANSLIAKKKTEGKPDMVDFIGKARDKVLEYLQAKSKEPVENERTEEVENVWLTNVFDDTNPVKPVRYFDDGSHITAKENIVEPQIATEPIIASHIIIIDSQFRANILPYSSNSASNSFNTSFTFNLTNQMLRAVSIKLYSYHIPTSWNAFTLQSGNTFFLYNGVIINIPDGNYTAKNIAIAINSAAQQNTATSSLVVAYNENANRISFTNTDPLLNTVTVMFCIQSNTVNITNCGAFVLENFQTLGVNTTLGWLLGFRTPPNNITGDIELFLAPNVVTYADVAPDTYGPKYFTLSVEDYSNQRLSSGLYNITNTKIYNTLSVPDYYNTIDVACKMRDGSLTQAQIFSINAISNPSTNKLNKVENNTLNGFTSNSTFAIIPLVDIQNIRPYPYIKFGADLFIYKRNYLQPTELERFTVSLTDDKGNLVNLYDNDWSFSLIVDERLN